MVGKLKRQTIQRIETAIAKLWSLEDMVGIAEAGDCWL
jgi:hypothetical protein